MNNDVVIEAQGLGKRYRLGTDHIVYPSLNDYLGQGLRAVARKLLDRRSTGDAFWALRDATFEVRRGENVGIIGLNGAGKSTTLKILSRITEPSTGVARVRGRVGALLEVGTGFHADLTGRENVFLYGAILGMSRDEVRRKFDAIVEFSGIAKFIDTPVKRYSSGMYVRLAFAVAAHLEPDILLLDEVLAVGDLPFQRKCMEFAKTLQKREATILFVSHNMFSIKTMCERALYLRQGRIAFDGPTEEAIRLYEDDCRLTALPGAGNRPERWPISITAFELTDERGQPRTVFDMGQSLRVRFRYETKHALENPNFVVTITRSDGVECCRYSTELDHVPTGRLEGTGTIELRTPPLRLVAELYTVAITVHEKGWQRVLRNQIGSTFHVRHELLDTHFGVFHEPGEWAVEPRSSVPGEATVLPLRAAND